MKKNFVLLLMFSFILLSCKNNENKNNEATSDTLANDKEEVEKVEEVVIENEKFEKFLTFFEKKTVPITFSLTETSEGELPLEYYEFIDFADGLIEPQFQFSVHNKYIGILALESGDGNTGADIVIYDKNGKVISSKYIDFYNYGIEYNIIKIDKFFNLFDLDMLSMREEEWVYGEDKMAQLTEVQSEPTTSVKKMYEIQKNGSITEGVPYLSVVDNFLEYLDYGNMEEAFKLQDNPNWGNLKQFSSTKAFGGILSVESVTNVVEKGDICKINCEAIYSDTINGSARIDQIFSVKKIKGKWKIIDMKVLEFEKVRRYSKSGGFLKIDKMTDKGFDFYLNFVSEYPEDSYKKYAGAVSGHAKFKSDNLAVFEDEDASLTFKFSKDQKKLEVIDKNCVKYRNEKVSFNGQYKISQYY